MSKIRVKISSTNITETVITPIFDGVFLHRIERDRIYYLQNPKSSPRLIGADFTLINNLVDECEKVHFIVERFCSGAWVEYWRGKFTKFDCEFNFFECSLTVKLKNDSKYQCVFDVWETEQNVYNSTGPTVSAREFYGTLKAGIECCDECRVSSAPFPVCSRTDACVESTTIKAHAPQCTSTQYYAVTCFHRIEADYSPGPPPFGTGWTLLSGTIWWRCPDPDADSMTIGVLRSGRKFNSVLEHMVSQTGCGLTVRSHFFGLNDTHPAAPVNDAYSYATQYYHTMTMHQKSDVKRPDGDQSFSFVWKMKLKNLLEDLQTMFNVFWRIDGSDLILEHISYFQANEGANYTDLKMPLQQNYDAKTVKKELFFWSDEDCSTLFKGQPIIYNCGNGEVSHKVSLFDTDVEFVHTEAYQDKVSDENFVLLSCAPGTSGVYFINNKNKPLAWTNLHDKLHRDYRLFTTGSLNGIQVTFNTVQPIKKQPEFTVPYCCDDTFDPTEYITTPLGVGYIDTASENLLKDTLTLQLNY